MIDIQILPQQRLPDGRHDLRHRAVAFRDGVEVGRVTVRPQAAPIAVLCRLLWKAGAAEDEAVNVWRGSTPVFRDTTVEYWASRFYREPDSENVKCVIKKNWREVALSRKAEMDDDVGDD